MFQFIKIKLCLNGAVLKSALNAIPLGDFTLETIISTQKFYISCKHWIIDFDYQFLITNFLKGIGQICFTRSTLVNVHYIQNDLF